MQRLDPNALLAHLEHDAARLAFAATDRLDRPVPSCPGWLMLDLLTHSGRGHRWVATVLAEGAEAPRPEGPPTGSDPVAWYREGSARLLAALRETPNDQETWNWSAGPQVASFWTRRMAQETLVHRWDAENAAGLGADVDPLIAVDGIDELLDVFWRRYADSSDADPPGGTLHVHCTDVDGEWWAGFEDGAYELRRTHEKGDVAVRGPAADVLLVLWGRRPPATLERLGDPAVFDDWLERATV